MKRLNVLIVHRDIEESRRAFRKIDWKKLGMQVVYCVTGGDAALGFMRQNHVDIVIADVTPHARREISSVPRTSGAAACCCSRWRGRRAAGTE